MSVSLLVFKGEDFNYPESRIVDEMPVSFQRVWKETWEKAISECKIKIFVCGRDVFNKYHSRCISGVGLCF